MGKLRPINTYIKNNKERGGGSDNRAKQPPGKCELQRNKSLMNKVCWEKLTGMDTVSFEKTIYIAETSSSTLKKSLQNLLNMPRKCSELKTLFKSGVKKALISKCED